MTTLEHPVTQVPDLDGEGDVDGAADATPTTDAEALAELAGTKRPDHTDLNIGEIFELLKNERRRRVIAFLKEQADQASTLDVVAEHIAALENDVDVAQISSSQRKRVYIALYQCHLPKMDHFGVIDFEKNRGTIELVDTAPLDPYLADPQRHEASDGSDDRTELVVAVGVAAVVAVGLTGIGILSAVPPAVWAGLSVLALLWSAAT